MINVLQYIPEQNSTWIDEYYEKMGDELINYYNRIFMMVFDMKRGDEFDIEEIVIPQNYDLFIKCLSLVLSEMAHYRIFSYYWEDTRVFKR